MKILDNVYNDGDVDDYDNRQQEPTTPDNKNRRRQTTEDRTRRMPDEQKVFAVSFHSL